MNRANLTFLDNQLEQEKDYWQRKLTGELVVSGLPRDFSSSGDASDAKRTLPIEIDGETQGRLHQLCGKSESLYLAVFIAALKICLHKYTGLEDIIVGTTIHERYSEMAALNKVLALRDRLDGATTVRELLGNCKDTLAHAYLNQKFPFERLLDLLNIEWLENRAPLFNVMVLLENINDRRNVAHLKHDVTLNFNVKGDCVTGSIEYRSQSLKEETVTVFRKHYERIIRAALQNPDQQISKLELLTEDEKHKLLFHFNLTQRDYPKFTTIDRLFAEQAARTPANIAVACDDSRLTFQALDRRANQLAHRLQSLGVGPSVPVAICLEHSLETVVGLLGVLKAGGYYVPLDPAHPKMRLSFILADARAPIVLTQDRLLRSLPESGAKIISLDSDWPEMELEDIECPPNRATADDLAYVIYTSGSTGEPKGVQIPHAALVNYVWWAKEMYLRGEDLDSALHSPLTFDLTVTAIYLPLVTGNKIIVYRAEAGDLVISRILESDQVGLLKLTPSHLSLISERDNTRSRIKRVIVGGEAFATKLAKQVYESFGGHVEIINEYGPTEATVGCMIANFDPQNDVQSFVPIGKPAANTQIYVLDERLQPVAENVVGELYISGDGLARGYLNKPELTAEKFIDNPFVRGQRMYKSGDLARWLPGEVLEYVGRRDDQIKFHGYRVELNEIRSALNRHSQIRDSIVRVIKDKKDNDVMIAYYVARRELEVSTLRAFLSETIIEETLPNIFVHLKKLPLTLNGKINHHALPQLEEIRQRQSRDVVEPRTLTEQTLAEIWQQVFSIQRVGIHDNFFELGGHSLLANQVIARVRKVFQVELLMRCLFESPTIAGLAQVVEESRSQQRNGDVQQQEITQRIMMESAEETLANVDRLSEAELDTLLSSMLVEENVEG